MKPHGTPARYTRQGCRCGPCVAAYSKYQRELRVAKSTFHEFEPWCWRPIKGHLPALCWCGNKVLKVPAAEVRACRTISCGEPFCHPGAILAK